MDKTIAIAIDLSRTFDTVNHELLLNLDLNNIKRFLIAYIQTYDEFRNKRSKFRKIRQGVPQRGVLSPVLFNQYMSKTPLSPPDIILVTYADDSNVLKSCTDIKKMCNDLNQYLQIIDTWYKNRK